MTNKEIKKWETTIIKDPDSDDLMIEFPSDFLDSIGWKVGDTFKWEINKEGYGAILTKVNNDESTHSK